MLDFLQSHTPTNAAPKKCLLMALREDNAVSYDSALQVTRRVGKSRERIWLMGQSSQLAASEVTVFRGLSSVPEPQSILPILHLLNRQMTVLPRRQDKRRVTGWKVPPVIDTLSFTNVDQQYEWCSSMLCVLSPSPGSHHGKQQTNQDWGTFHKMKGSWKTDWKRLRTMLTTCDVGS